MLLAAWVRLANVANDADVNGLNSRALHALLSEFGSPQAVLEASLASLARVVGPALAAALRDRTPTPAIEHMLAWSAVSGNHLLTWDDPRYPRSLLELGDAPVLLFCKGDPLLLNAPAIAIVGSRNASPAGLLVAEEFAAALASAGLTVISGLALGIDAAAHRGALRALAGIGQQSASTIAVIGTGIDRVYPPRNRGLAHQIAKRGAIVSEFPLETPPFAGNFPRRNRLISGLAQGVLVVEATLGSGSLITARLAGEQGREVFAIPGSIHSPFSKGCHKLIREGAKLVETAEDVLEELKWPGAVSDRASSTRKRDTKDARASGPDGTLLLDALGFAPTTTDELCARLGWPVDRVLASMLQLELAGSLAHTSGGRVQRIA